MRQSLNRCASALQLIPPAFSLPVDPWAAGRRWCVVTRFDRRESGQQGAGDDDNFKRRHCTHDDAHYGAKIEK